VLKATATVALLGSVFAPAAVAQHETERRLPGAERLSAAVEHVVRGRLLVDLGESTRPVTGTWVILHRVGSDSAGPLDSVRTGPAGVYTIRYARSPDDDAIYFVSGSHGGIAYFSGPLRAREVGGEEGDIIAFDTTSSMGILRTLGRHVVIGRLRDGRREIIEAIEIANDTALTVVAAGDDRPSWTAVLPEAAADFTLGEGDVGDGGLVLNAGRLELYAPVAPGIKQISFGYTIPAADFPISIPIGDSLAILEVLIESRIGAAEGAGLREVDPAVTAGRTFRRFLSERAPPNSVILISVGEDGDRRSWILPVLMLAGGVLAAVLALAVRRQSVVAAADGELAGGG
jgi:hypothetical protein